MFLNLNTWFARSRIKSVLNNLRGRSEHRLFEREKGRWLWNEPFQLRQHTRIFDVDALKNVVARVAGSSDSAVSFEKLAEGASNKVYRAFVGRRRFIVKVPDPVVPSCRSTASEVATLDFLRSELQFPVPKVFAWHDSEDNAVGCEYIVMEEAAGEPLDTVWQHLKSDKKLAIVKHLDQLLKQLWEASNKFQGYGSIYFVNDTSRLGVVDHLPLATALTSRYCLGPLANEHFCNNIVESSKIHCGPWRHPEDYLDSIVRSSKVQINAHATQPEIASQIAPFSLPIAPISDSSAEALYTMLDATIAATSKLVPRDTAYKLPLLWHGDLHHGNIFVDDEGKITCIIDWQNVHVLPTYLQATVPKFLRVDHSETMTALPVNFEDMDGPEKKNTWQKFFATALQQLHHAFLRENMPNISAVVQDDDDLNRLRCNVTTFAHISNHFEHSAFLLREVLLRVQRRWSEFDIELTQDTQCPVNFDKEETTKHYQDGRVFNQFQDTLSQYHVPVALEGWVFSDEFKQQKENLDSAIESVSASLGSGKERQEFRRRLETWQLTE